MKHISVLMVLSLLTMVEPAVAQTFETTVGPSFVWPDVLIMKMTNSTMDLNWFTQRGGGRTVYSNDVNTGTMVHGRIGNQIMAHATWVVSYDPQSRTVNLNRGKTHITNWYFDQRCHVYEDGTCDCDSNPNW